MNYMNNIEIMSSILPRAMLTAKIISHNLNKADYIKDSQKITRINGISEDPVMEKKEDKSQQMKWDNFSVGNGRESYKEKSDYYSHVINKYFKGLDVDLKKIENMSHFDNVDEDKKMCSLITSNDDSWDYLTENFHNIFTDPKKLYVVVCHGGILRKRILPKLSTLDIEKLSELNDKNLIKTKKKYMGLKSKENYETDNLSSFLLEYKKESVDTQNITNKKQRRKILDEAPLNNPILIDAFNKPENKVEFNDFEEDIIKFDRNSELSKLNEIDDLDKLKNKALEIGIPKNFVNAKNTKEQLINMIVNKMNKHKDNLLTCNYDYDFGSYRYLSQILKTRFSDDKKFETQIVNLITPNKKTDNCINKYMRYTNPEIMNSKVEIAGRLSRRKEKKKKHKKKHTKKK